MPSAWPTSDEHEQRREHVEAHRARAAGHHAPATPPARLRARKLTRQRGAELAGRSPRASSHITTGGPLTLIEVVSAPLTKPAAQPPPVPAAARAATRPVAQLPRRPRSTTATPTAT